MTKTFEDALALFVQQKCNLDYIPVIVNTDFLERQEYNYSEYTMDYDNSRFIIDYKNPLYLNQKPLVYEIDIEQYGFADLVKDIAALMV